MSDGYYHGGYGECSGFGTVYLSDGTSTRLGPECPVCVEWTRLIQAAHERKKLPLIVGVAYRLPVPAEETYPYARELLISAPAPARHANLNRTLGLGMLSMVQPDCQGFLTSEGKFLSREDAAILALANGQVKALSAPPRLFSEDLW